MRIFRKQRSECFFITSWRVMESGDFLGLPSLESYMVLESGHFILILALIYFKLPEGTLESKQFWRVDGFPRSFTFFTCHGSLIQEPISVTADLLLPLVCKIFRTALIHLKCSTTQRFPYKDFHEFLYDTICDSFVIHPILRDLAKGRGHPKNSPWRPRERVEV